MAGKVILRRKGALAPSGRFGMKKIVLAYSGGLDTSVAIKWLKEKYDAHVVAFCADLGQKENMMEIKKKALANGALKVYVSDLRQEFTRDYVFPMLRANAVYESGYLLGTSIARPLIAKKQMEIALKEKAFAVAHGATGKGNDQVRFELAYYALSPGIQVIAPWRQWEMSSREDLMEYAKDHGIPVAATKKNPYSVDMNLLHISYEGGVLEDPWAEPPSDMYTMMVPPEKAPARPTYLEIGYELGDPVSINGKKAGPSKLLEKLNAIAGINGVGRVDIVENRYVGMKSRGVYETPGGTVLHIAHRAVESLTLDREVLHLRDSLVPKYAELVYNGYWFSPERETIQGVMDSIQRNVSGTARLKLYKGSVQVVGRKSPVSLYHPEYATFGADRVYEQSDAEGFIKLNSLRLRINRMLR
jgi:argininosuccinate synthase